MLNIQVERNIVENICFFSSLKLNLSVAVEISVDEKSANTIEVAEDALGDDVYINYLKFGRKLVDKTENDEERV
jgi:hypothetical protein